MYKRSDGPRADADGSTLNRLHNRAPTSLAFPDRHGLAGSGREAQRTGLLALPSATDGGTNPLHTPIRAARLHRRRLAVGIVCQRVLLRVPKGLLHRNASVVGAGSGARGEAGRQQRRPTDLRGVPARIAPGARASWWAISPPACSSRPAGEHMLPTGCRYHLSARACNLSVQTPTARSRTCHGQTRSMYDGKEADKEERRRLLAVWPCGWTWEAL